MDSFVPIYDSIPETYLLEFNEFNGGIIWGGGGPTNIGRGGDRPKLAPARCGFFEPRYGNNNLRAWAEVGLS